MASSGSTSPKTFSAEAPEYFLGSIVINNAQAPRLSVIDGQQRLITTAVLISALRNHLRAEGQSELAAFLEQQLPRQTRGGAPALGAVPGAEQER